VDFITGSVQARSTNAENESTYLHTSVRIAEEIPVVNLKAEELENSLHRALD
jgi:hypothetical protein